MSNQKRLKAGKLPLYETKELVLTPHAGRPEGAVRGTGGHDSPRQHLRRGHIRRLADINMWCNSCVVGSSAMGWLTKVTE